MFLIDLFFYIIKMYVLGLGMLRKLLIFLFLFISSINLAISDTFRVNKITLEDPWIKTLYTGQKNIPGYLKIINTSNKHDYLVSIDTDFSNKSEIHKMIIKNDIMKMIKIKSGLIIKKNSFVLFKPGSHHLMLMGIYKKIENKKQLNITLNFKNNGTIEIPFIIKKRNKNKHHHNH